MPRRLGPRLDDMISRLAYRAMPIRAGHYKAWPNFAGPVSMTAGSPTGGAWAEVISAAAAPTTPFTVMVANFYSVVEPVTFEVGIGGAGAEVSVASVGLVSRYSSGQAPTYGVPQPMPIIPGGSRVVVRALSRGPALVCYVKLISILLPQRLDSFNTLLLSEKLSSAPLPTLSGLSMPKAIGATSAAAVWTYGAYLEMYAATVEAATVVLTGFSWQSDCAAGIDSQFAIATGGAGSEVDFLTIPFHTEGAMPSWHIDFPIPLILPGSTRLSCRHATDALTAQNADYPLFTVVKSAVMP